nr:hypothetical protein [Tanacetum cinerariifolium]
NYDYLYKPCPDQPLETTSEEDKAAWKAEYKKHNDATINPLKSKVIDILTTTFESASNPAEVIEAKVVNCEANLVAFVSPLTFSDSLKPNKFVEPAQVTNGIDDCMDIENDPSKYCLDNMTIGIEEDTRMANS